MTQEPTCLVPLSNSHLQLINVLINETLKGTGATYAGPCVDFVRHIEASIKAAQAQTAEPPAGPPGP